MIRVSKVQSSWQGSDNSLVITRSRSIVPHYIAGCKPSTLMILSMYRDCINHLLNEVEFVTSDAPQGA